MKIGFTVGQIEQHQVELSFDQTSGALLIMMDGTQVLHDRPKLAMEPVKKYELSIGSGEKHRLALQLTYGGEAPGEMYVPAIPRLSLMLTPIQQ